MPLVSVIVSSTSGRERQLARCIEGYTEVGGELELIPVEASFPEAGWAAGAAHATGRYLHLTTDEFEPHPGWIAAAEGACRAHCFPAPLIYRLDGTVESPDGALIDWRPVASAEPAFLPARLWRTMIDKVDLGVLPFERWPTIAFGPTQHELRLRLEYAFTRWA